MHLPHERGKDVEPVPVVAGIDPRAGCGGAHQDLGYVQRRADLLTYLVHN